MPIKVHGGSNVSAVAIIVAMGAAPAAHAGLETLALDDTRDAELPQALVDTLAAFETGISAESADHVRDGVILRNILVSPEDGQEVMIEEIMVDSQDGEVRVSASRDDGMARFVTSSDVNEIDLDNLDIQLATPEDNTAHISAEGASVVRSWMRNIDGTLNFDEAGNPDGDPVFHAEIASGELIFATAPDAFQMSIAARDVRTDYLQTIGTGIMTEHEIKEGPPEGHFNVAEFGFDIHHEGLPDDEDADALHEALEDGAFFSMQAVLHGIESVNQNRHGDETRTDLGQAGLSVNADAEMLRISTETSDLTVTPDLASILPRQDGRRAEIGMQRQHFSMILPVLGSPDPQEMGLSLAFMGITADEQGWDSLDPEGELPRDPMNFRFDVDGAVQMEDPMTDVLKDGLGQLFMFGPGPLLGQIDAFDIDIASEMSGLGAELFLDAVLSMGADDPTPQASGALRMVGLEESLEGLSNSPFFGPKVMMPMTAMTEQLAERGEDGSQVINFEIDQNGDIMVNGMPLPM